MSALSVILLCLYWLGICRYGVREFSLNPFECVEISQFEGFVNFNLARHISPDLRGMKFLAPTDSGRIT